MKAFFRGSLAMLVGSVALLGASTAFAAGEICFNDTDCPGGGAVCGGDVCNWNKANAAGTAEKPYTCNPAGTDAKTMDGWCTATNGNADCKCASAGAKCVGVHCSFTKASDAPAGGSPAGGAATGGSPAAGSPATGGAGSPAAGGSPSTAGTPTTTTAGTAATPPAAESSGCSVSAPIGSRGAAALALGMLGVGLAFSRRRR